MDREHIALSWRNQPLGLTRLPFSDAVRIGETLYISGRIGLDPATMRPPAHVADEARLLLDDLRAVLAAADMTLGDLVMVTIFAPDVSDFAAFNEIYVPAFDGPLPARAFVGSGPLLFGARFELTAVAVASTSK